jgi:mono/diheme cytochrome c family protein
MLKYLISAALMAAIATGTGHAQSSPTVTIPVKKTEATSGRKMFESYCAPCHGVDGKGHGPVGSALKTPPFDLSMLSRTHAGQFPTKHVIEVLRFGVDIPSHGSTTMPIWGPVLGNMSSTNPAEQQLRINNLVEYLKTIQMK